MNQEKIKEINEKKWFQILRSQYIQLFTDKQNIKQDANLELNTKYPLLLEFTKKVVRKLNKHFIQFKMNGE